MKDQSVEICKQIKSLQASGANHIRCVMYDTSRGYDAVDSIFEVYLNDPECRSPILKSGKPAAFFKPWLVPCDKFEISVLSLSSKKLTTNMTISIEQKFENMRRQYRKCQAELKEAKKILREYDGSHAIDQWDEDSMPSKKWVAKAKKFSK